MTGRSPFYFYFYFILLFCEEGIGDKGERVRGLKKLSCDEEIQ